MSYAKQVADRARADLQRRRDSISKEIDARQEEVKEIDAILAGIEAGSKSTSPPKRSTPTTRNAQAKKLAARKTQPTVDSSGARPTGRPSNKDRLVRRLADGPIARDEIVKYLDSTEQTVSGIINDLVRDGTIRVDDDDKVVLA